MTRSISRITALALAITAVAVPAAPAQDKVTPDARDAGRPAAPISRVTPDAQDAARPAPPTDRVSPDARDNGRRVTAPVVVSPPTAVQADHFDWFDAGIGAALVALLLAGTAAATVRMRRGSARAA